MAGYLQGPRGRTWYRVDSTAAGTGTPLLVVHGGPGAPHDYLEPLSALRTERPVIFYDQVGCGRSDQPEGYTGSVADFVAELALLRAELGLSELNILGQSWGTMLAVEYLLAHGTAGVRHLVLSAPFLSTDRWMADQRTHMAGLPAPERDAIARCEAAGRFEDPEYEEAMMSFYRRHVCRMAPWPAELQATFANLGTTVYNAMWGPSEFTLTGSLREADLTRDLHRINVPTLLTAGQYDEVTPATARYYAGLLPDSQVLVLANASHSHHLEAREEYLQAVRAFLEQPPT